MIETTRYGDQDYAKVKARLLAFRREFPFFGIHTEPISIDGNKIVVRAQIYHPNGHVLSTGLGEASRKEINKYGKEYDKKGPLQKAETSAIGRALHNFGFQSDGDDSIAMEMKKALEQLEAKAEAKRLAAMEPRPLDALPQKKEEYLKTTTNVAPKAPIDLSDDGEIISDEEYEILIELRDQTGDAGAKLEQQVLNHFRIGSLSELPAGQYAKIMGRFMNLQVNNG